MKRILAAMMALQTSAAIMGCGSSQSGGSMLDNGSPSGGSAPGGERGGTGTGVEAGGGLSLGLGGSQAAPTTGTGGMLDPGMACATGTATASLSDVRMLVMFDRSGSMNDEAIEATAETRWDLASAALSGFFAEPSAAGLQVALRFFPHDEPAAGCNDDDCSVMACTEPIVPLATLAEEPGPMDSHEAALIAATIAAVPEEQGGGQQGGGGGGTPISAALGGALTWAAQQRNVAPDEAAVVVLVTDGQPRGCDEEVANIAALAADALASTGTRTYAIGLTGSQEADMDAIAAAGGTTEGIFISDGVAAQQELLDALSAIRGSALDCDFPLPEAGPGMVVDPSQINVSYTPSGGVPTTLGRVMDEASCGTAPGWFYDDPQSPSAIRLCPGSCSAATIDVNASLSVLLGCVTEERDPA